MLKDRDQEMDRLRDARDALSKVRCCCWSCFCFLILVRMGGTQRHRFFPEPRNCKESERSLPLWTRRTRGWRPTGPFWRETGTCRRCYCNEVGSSTPFFPVWLFFVDLTTPPPWTQTLRSASCRPKWLSFSSSWMKGEVGATTTPGEKILSVFLPFFSVALLPGEARPTRTTTSRSPGFEPSFPGAARDFGCALPAFFSLVLSLHLSSPTPPCFPALIFQSCVCVFVFAPCAAGSSASST